MERTQLRKALQGTAITVTESEFDDMGAVLSQMGLPFREVDSARLAGRKGPLSTTDVLMVNCGSPQTNPRVVRAIRRFVADGGVLWTSDWQFELVQDAFGSDVLSASRSGEVDERTARPSDPDLKRVIGSSIRITFDMPSWAEIASVATSEGHFKGEARSAVTVHLEAGGQPIVISFRYGRGRVVHTSFHNHAQTSKAEERLLKCLALQPIAHLAKRPVSELYREVER